MPRKFGRIRPAILPHLNAKIPRFGEYLPKLKAPPLAQSWVKPWPGIMGDNDQIGSCGPTSLANILKCQSTNALGSPIILSTADIVSFYSLVSGYDPSKTNPATGNNPTDVGVDLADMLTKSQTEGIGGHKILGFCSVDPQNSINMEWASIIGCGLIFGVNLPQSAEDQLDANQPWKVVIGSRILGGHAIANYGYTAAGKPGESWSEKILMTPPWVDKYTEEAMVVITDSVVNSQKVSPSGLDFAGMMSDIAWFAKNA